MDILLYFGGPALIAFLIQFLVGCRTQHKILRYIPIYCFVITLAFAIIALTSDSGFFLDADRILVMEDGQIVGRGKHRELLHTCPLYREIAELQLGEEEVKHELECV